MCLIFKGTKHSPQSPLKLKKLVGIRLDLFLFIRIYEQIGQG